MSPGMALVPDGCGGTPAVHDACTAGRTMTTRAHPSAALAAAILVRLAKRAAIKNALIGFRVPIDPTVARPACDCCRPS